MKQQILTSLVRKIDQRQYNFNKKKKKKILPIKKYMALKHMNVDLVTVKEKNFVVKFGKYLMRI